MVWGHRLNKQMEEPAKPQHPSLSASWQWIWGNHGNGNEARTHLILICPPTVIPSPTPSHLFLPSNHFLYLPKELFLFLHYPFSTFRNRHGSSARSHYMLQEFHSRVYTQRILSQHTTQVLAHLSSSLRHSQYLGRRSGLHIHQQVTTFQRCVDVVASYSTTKKNEMMTFSGIGGTRDHCVQWDRLAFS